MAGYGQGYGTGRPNDFDYTDTELRAAAHLCAEALSPSAFVLARIAEDEADADDAHLDACDRRFPCVCGYPARVLARCSALRAVVERCSAVDFAMPSTHLAHGVLAELAAAYAEHPDYRPEWAL